MSAASAVLLPEELEKRGRYGPVQSTERICRFIRSGKAKELKQDRTVRASAVSTRDLSNHDLSVWRMSYISDTELKERGEASCSPGATLAAYGIWDVARVREIITNEERAYLVLDRPVPDSAQEIGDAHAAVGSRGDVIDLQNLQAVKKQLVEALDVQLLDQPPETNPEATSKAV